MGPSAGGGASIAGRAGRPGGGRATAPPGGRRRSGPGHAGALLRGRAMVCGLSAGLRSAGGGAAGGQPPELSLVSLVEMIVAGAFALVGLFSLRKWLRVDFEAASGGERIIYAIHVTARVGLWFAFAGFFFGYALVHR